MGTIIFDAKAQDHSLEKDWYGRIVKSESGKTINYSEAETAKAINMDSISGSKIEKSIIENIDGSWSPLWGYAIMGESIGRNSMHSVDVDNDGVKELVCSAKINYSSSFWYILKYSSISNKYDQLWVSKIYNASITNIEVYEEGAGKGKIFVGTDEGEIDVYDLTSFERIEKITTDLYEINKILINDADNDGIIDLVFCDDYKILIYNLDEYSFKNTYDYGGNDFAIGDVDNDSKNEIVYTNGNVIRVDSDSANVIWDFYSGFSECANIELCDIDGDNMSEIICAASWYDIFIYDADVQLLKHQINASLDIHCLLVEDYDNDGVVDIVYGDGQWGQLHFINANTWMEYKTIDNPEHGVTEINIDDIDNDGQKEVIWGAGWTSSGEDNLFVANINTGDVEYRSLHLDGPFYAIEIGNIDDDLNDEIVTLSYESESGYGGGILTIFDAQTHEIEWQTSGDFFGNVWTGMYNIELLDVDNDGITEIVLAAGNPYTGKIWIIDAQSKLIELEHEYSYSSAFETDEFYALAIGDVDQDSSIEYVVATDGDLYVMSSLDFSNKWSHIDLWSNKKPNSILIANVDSDSVNEIIVCANKIHIIDGLTHSVFISVNNYYTSCTLFDINNDGKNELVASTKYGKVEILDPATLDLIREFSFTENEIRNVQLYKNDTSNMFVIASDLYVSVFSENGEELKSIPLGSKSGLYDALKIFNDKGDGHVDILVGTDIMVAEFSTDETICQLFRVNIKANNVSCMSDNDGSAKALPMLGTGPYSYLWNNNKVSSELGDLVTGNYSVTVTDSNGCVAYNSVKIKESDLSVYLESTNIQCGTINTGTASVIINQGIAPYSYAWNNNQVSETITGVDVGEYSVIVTDSMGCIDSSTVTITKDEVLLDVTYHDIKCFGDINGYINVSPNGVPPYELEWSNGDVSDYLYNLESGDYSLTVTDSRGCKTDSTITLSEPEQMKLEIETVPDDTSSVVGEGVASIINIEGGTPPYFISWNDPFQQNTPTATNLIADKYTVTVRDVENCYIIDTVLIEALITDISENTINSTYIYPNPNNGCFKVNLSGLENALIQLFNINGQEVYNNQLNQSNVNSIKLPELPKGVYLLKMYSKGLVITERLIVE